LAEFLNIQKKNQSMCSSTIKNGMHLMVAGRVCDQGEQGAHGCVSIYRKSKASKNPRTC
jgi:hypothetical protein